MNYNDIAMYNNSLIFKIVDNFEKDRNLHTHLKAFEDVALHSHEFYEFLYVVKGSCIHVLNGKESEIKSGDFIFIPLGVSHTLKNSTYDFIHRDIIIKPNYFNKLVSQYKFFKTDKIYQLNISVQDIDTSEYLCTYLKGDSDAEKIIVNYLLMLIYKSTTIHKKVEKSWLTTLIAILKSPNYFSKDINSILDTFGYTKEHIRREFKKYQGESITDYWNRQKMKYAYNQMKNTDITIGEICEKINFENETYFYRLFKKTFNVTPKQIR